MQNAFIDKIEALKRRVMKFKLIAVKGLAMPRQNLNNLLRILAQ